MLLVSIHDVSPRHLDQVKRLRARVAEWGVGAVTLLVVPDYHAAAPLLRSQPARAWLRERAGAGDEICLHGYYHQQRRQIADRVSRLRAALFTAGEGECLALDEGHRATLLGLGKALVEEVAGVEVRGFVAPGWLEPAGFRAHLRAAGFTWHESRYFVERVADGARRWAPVLSFATRTRAREEAALAWVRALRRPLARSPVVRLALHPADLTSPTVMACAEETVRQLVARHSATGATASLWERGDMSAGRSRSAALRHAASPRPASLPNERSAPLSATNSDP
jgi:predicted deacetylase